MNKKVLVVWRACQPRLPGHGFACRQSAHLSKRIGRAQSNCRGDSATIAPTIASAAERTALTIAASTTSFITARRYLMVAATWGLAIAIGAVCCAVTPELCRTLTYRCRRAGVHPHLTRSAGARSAEPVRVGTERAHCRPPPQSKPQPSFFNQPSPVPVDARALIRRLYQRRSSNLEFLCLWGSH
jgi:hypothetical protein